MAEIRGSVATLRRSPLAHLEERMRAASVAGRVTLREAPFRTMVNLRVRPGTTPAARLEAALRATLPTACGGTARARGHTLLWLGPDEWLLVSDGPAYPAEPAALVDELRAALGDGPGSVVDVSANRTTLELDGPAARQVLEKGCALDLHPRSFGPGRACSTLLGPVQLILWQAGDAPSYRLLPRSSYADYTARWLLDAMAEYT